MRTEIQILGDKTPVSASAPSQALQLLQRKQEPAKRVNAPGCLQKAITFRDFALVSMRFAPAAVTSHESGQIENKKKLFSQEGKSANSVMTKRNNDYNIVLYSMQKNASLLSRSSISTILRANDSEVGGYQTS